MPAKAAEKLESLDPKKLSEAIHWAIEYLLDPKRGDGETLPSDKEFKLRFQNPEITQKLIQYELKNLLDVKSIEEIQELDQKKIQEVLEETESKKDGQQAKQPIVTTGGGRIIQFPSKRVSALGVLAEIDTVLENHKNSTSPKLTGDLSPKIRELLPKIGVKNLSEERLAQIVDEVARETVRQTFEDAAKIQSVEQINNIVADSLTQTLITNAQIASKIKPDSTKLFEQVFGKTNDVVSANQDNLEKAAVLANMQKINSMQEENENIKELISQSVQQSTLPEAPLATPQEQALLTSNLTEYLETYKQELFKELKISPDNVPTLKQFQQTKEAAHEFAAKEAQEKLANTPQGKQISRKVTPSKVTGNFAQSLRLSNKQQTITPPKIPFLAKVVLSNPDYATKAYHAALAHDETTTAKAIKENTERIERLKKKRSLSHKERKELFWAQQSLARYTSAQNLKIQAPRTHPTLMRIMAKFAGGRAEVASQQAWRHEFYVKRNMPNSFYSEREMAGSYFGSLGFNFSGFSPGSLLSSIRNQMGATSALGMGMSPVKSINRIRNKVTVAIGAPITGLMLYLMSLGQAAVTGAIIGMGVGGAAGAVIPVAFLGPAGVFLWPVTMPLGIVMGGATGALIGLGIASGSATLISMGTASATGAIIGGYIGFGVGAAAGAALAAACIAFTLGLCTPFAPFIIVGSTAIGTAIGAALGFLIGLATGYLIGKFLITPAISAFKSVLSGFNAGVGSGVGLLSSIGSFLTGIGSTIWGGLSSVAGGTLSFISGGLSSLVGGGFGLGATTASAAAIPVATGITAVATAGAVAGIIIPAAIFFSLASDEVTPIVTPGQNQYFTLTKTAVPDRIQNSALPTDINYTINLQAKTNLDGVQITDEVKVQKQSGSFTQPTDKNGQIVSPPCAATIPQKLDANQTWSCTITIRAEANFTDALVANTVTVKATPEGQAEFSDNSTATTVIGTPPTVCAILNIQGPWSQEEKNNINAVCQALDQSPQFVSLLQKAGTIKLERVSEGSLGNGVCGTVNGGSVVRISCQMTPVSFAKYVIIHEFGHVLGNYNGALFNEFIATFNQEGLMPTYPFDVNSADESFAEMTTEYVISKEYNHPARAWSSYPGGPWTNPGPNWGTFQQDRPAHYNFAKTKIFGGKEY